MQKKTNQDLNDILDQFKANLFRDLNCVKVGKIISFSAETMQAEVEIVVSRIVDIDSQGVKTLRRIPVLVEVPCIVLQGGGSFIQMPIKENDFCILLFSDEDLDNWIETDEQKPASTRRHSLSDALCLVGINGKTSLLTQFDGDGIKLFLDDSNFITLKTDGIEFTGVTTFKDDMTVEGDAEFTGSVTHASETNLDGSVSVGGQAGFTGACSPTQTSVFVNGICISAS